MPAEPLSPGDQARPGAPDSGEDICPVCQGTGRLQGEDCANCSGTGRVTVVVNGE